MSAKLSILSDLGEGISQPPTANQAAFPNDGLALYGPYAGSLGPDGLRLRLRLFYSGGESARALPTPNCVHLQSGGRAAFV